MSSHVDAVLKLTREIFHLEQQERAIRAKREAKKVELARVLSGQSTDVEPARPEFRAGSLPARVLDLLMSERPRSLTADEICRVLGRDVNGVRAVLSRLKAGGQIEKTGRGAYRAIGEVSSSAGDELNVGESGSSEITRKEDEM